MNTIPSHHFINIPYRTENITISTVLILNILLQSLTIRKYWLTSNGGGGRFWDRVKRTAMHRTELLVYITTLASNVFFILRLLPIWKERSCFQFHGIVMAIFEIQLGVYSYVQLSRFGKLQIPPTVFRVCIFALGVCSVLLAVFAATSQNGYTNNEQCHFVHDWRVCLASAVFHLGVDSWVLVLFWRSVEASKAARKRVKVSERLQVRVSRARTRVDNIYRIAIGVLVCFGVWSVYLSVANLLVNSLVLEVSYNFHFTLISLAMLAPRLAKNTFKSRPSTTTTSALRSFTGANRSSSTVPRESTTAPLDSFAMERGPSNVSDMPVGLWAGRTPGQSVRFSETAAV